MNAEQAYQYTRAAEQAMRKKALAEMSVSDLFELKILYEEALDAIRHRAGCGQTMIETRYIYDGDVYDSELPLHWIVASWLVDLGYRLEKETHHRSKYPHHSIYLTWKPK